MEKRHHILPLVNSAYSTVESSTGCSTKLITGQNTGDLYSCSKSKNLSNLNDQTTEMYTVPLCVPSLNWVPCPSCKFSYRAKLVFHRSTFKLLRM